jgi:hypothetical protein
VQALCSDRRVIYSKRPADLTRFESCANYGRVKSQIASHAREATSGYPRNSAALDAKSYQVLRHHHRHADLGVVGLMKLAPEWAGLYPITGTAEI